MESDICLLCLDFTFYEIFNLNINSVLTISFKK